MVDFPKFFVGGGGIEHSNYNYLVKGHSFIEVRVLDFDLKLPYL